jgi:transcriptional regulator with XRE-family HTH domain
VDLNGEIGLRLTKLREARGLTTRRLAARSGFSQAHISKLEGGWHSFKSDTLLSLATAMGVPIFYLLMTEDDWETYQTGLEARGRPRHEMPPL